MIVHESGGLDIVYRDTNTGEIVRFEKTDVKGSYIGAHYDDTGFLLDLFDCYFDELENLASKKLWGFE